MYTINLAHVGVSYLCLTGLVMREENEVDSQQFDQLCAVLADAGKLLTTYNCFASIREQV